MWLKQNSTTKKQGECVMIHVTIMENYVQISLFKGCNARNWRKLQKHLVVVQFVSLAQYTVMFGHADFLVWHRNIVSWLLHRCNFQDKGVGKSLYRRWMATWRTGLTSRFIHSWFEYARWWHMHMCWWIFLQSELEKEVSENLSSNLWR